MAENLNFEISSALKNILGKDLITDDFVAIFELVKNSLDAGATHTIIHFDIKNKQISIIDNGKGMSKSDIIEKWLFVAYSAKREGHEDDQHKTYAGNKGVGRFSCDRLGEKLKIQTKTKHDKTIHTLKVNWSDFEVDSKYFFTEVPVKYATDVSFKTDAEIDISESGTILQISLLRDFESWTRKKFLLLKRSLEKLIDPLNQDFGVLELSVPHEKHDDNLEKAEADLDDDYEPDIINGEIRSTVFDILKDRTTTIFADVNSDGILHVELIDRGEQIYITEESIDDSFPHMKTCEFQAQLSFLNRSAKYIFKRKTGINAIDFGSVFLIRNGYRIYPVGEEGFDYWGIDKRKQQGHSRYLGSREINGFVKISGSDELFKESTSRDKGLIKNDPVKELVALVRLCLRKLEMYVVDITWKDKLDNDTSDSSRMKLDSNRAKIIKLVEKLSYSNKINVISFNEDLVSILNEKALEFEPSLKKLKNIASNLNDSDLIDQVQKAEAALLKSKKAEQEAEKKAQEESEARKRAEAAVKKKNEDLKAALEKQKKTEEAYEEEKKRSLFLSLNENRDKEILEQFMHQIVLYASNIKEDYNYFLEDISTFSEIKEEDFLDFLTEQLESIEKIISTSRFATTGNFRLKSSEITEDLSIFIQDYIGEIIPGYHDKMDIKSEIDTNSFVTTFNPIEFGMMLENIISNSSKANATSISFSSTVKNKILTLKCDDNGNGLDPSIIEPKRIFEKGYSRTPGSGMGLFFAKSYIERYSGDIDISETQPDMGFSLTIKVVQ